MQTYTQTQKLLTLAEIEFHGISKAQGIGTLLDRQQLCAVMRNGNWWRIRRNGATKLWKRDAERFAIPVKAGLKACCTITEASDLTNFATCDDLDAAGIKHT
jgi:hypothetical protein